MQRLRTSPASVKSFIGIPISLALFITSLAPVSSAAPAVETRSVGQLRLQNIPTTPPAVRDRLTQYSNTRSAGFQSFTPQGGILISTRFGETSQIHEVRQPLGARSQLTFYSEPVGGAKVRPGNSGNFLFAKDQGGDEFYQGYLFDRTTGQATQLTEPGTRNDGFTFSRNGQQLAWTVSRKNSTQREIVIANPDRPNSRKVVFSSSGAWGVLDISPNGQQLLLGEFISATQSKRAILNINSGQLTPITPELQVAYDGGDFSADGRSIYLLTDEGSEFTYGVNINLASGSRKRITPKQDWDVEGMSVAPDERAIAYQVNEDGISKLYTQPIINLYTRPGIQPRRLVSTVYGDSKLVPLPIGIIGGVTWHPDSSKLGFSLSTAKAPGDAFTFDVRDSLRDGKAERRLTRWTESEIGGLNPTSFVEPTLIRYPTFDRPRRIPAFLYKPNKQGPHPVIINIHGGPEAQSRPGFSSSTQYWVNELGAAVIVPNVRGSSGYGKTYLDLDNGFKREDSVKDIGALLDWIATQPDLDKNRVVVYGGSYGGYMVLAALTNYGDRLAGGIDIVGISNFTTFLQNTQSYRRDLRRVEYGDERDPAMRAFQERISPLNNAAKISKPLFVIQGANDPRVPQSEAEQIVAKVRANGSPVWYMLALDEGHGFAKKSNRDAQREAETLFFQKVFGDR
jgi:dipeptidyl aminopeptidase/acylaminoacyl peptidase